MDCQRFARCGRSAVVAQIKESSGREHLLDSFWGQGSPGRLSFARQTGVNRSCPVIGGSWTR